MSTTLQDPTQLSLPVVPRHRRHPPHRHAAPSGPWPWIDLDYVESENRDWPEASQVYPQSHFGNWTHSQVRKCGIKAAIDKVCKCEVYTVDVLSSGAFEEPETRIVTETTQSRQAFKGYLETPRDQDNRVRTLCVENMSGSVLQMLGTLYNIEPFFFSSSLNWIPSRYQEDLQPGQGDHITITLTFLRKMKIDNPGPYPRDQVATTKVNRGINTQDGLYLDSDSGNSSVLCRDLLAVHMVRSVTGSTIISYHPSPTSGGTSAKNLYSRVHLAGQSVYWTNLFKVSRDPTFVLLTILWHALYAWDEALTCLYEHISDQESAVINTKDNKLTLRTQELHRIRAHLLYYASLLDDFKKSVKFVLDTPNPAMDALEHGTEGMLTKEDSAERLKTECNNLLSEIDRLEMSRSNQSKRLKNIMNLAFATVNIDDSKTMQVLTKAAAQDSAAMKQIAYLTMIFLPSSFIAGIFGMNITIINPSSVGTLAHYFAVAVPMTLMTIWAVVAFNPKKDYAGVTEGQPEASYSTRLAWPVRAWKSVFLSRTSNAQRDLEAQEDPPAYSHSDH